MPQLLHWHRSYACLANLVPIPGPVRLQQAHGADLHEHRVPRPPAFLVLEIGQFGKISYADRLDPVVNSFLSVFNRHFGHVFRLPTARFRC